MTIVDLLKKVVALVMEPEKPSHLVPGWQLEYADVKEETMLTAKDVHIIPLVNAAHQRLAAAEARHSIQKRRVPEETEQIKKEIAKAVSEGKMEINYNLSNILPGDTDVIDIILGILKSHGYKATKISHGHQYKIRWE